MEEAIGKKHVANTCAKVHPSKRENGNGPKRKRSRGIGEEVGC